MKMKSALYINLILLFASIATAQVPCGPAITPPATLSVNWAQFLYDPAHSGCNPYESVLSVNTVGSLTTKWQYQTGQNLVVSFRCLPMAWSILVTPPISSLEVFGL